MFGMVNLIEFEKILVNFFFKLKYTFCFIILDENLFDNFSLFYFSYTKYYIYTLLLTSFSLLILSPIYFSLF